MARLVCLTLYHLDRSCAAVTLRTPAKADVLIVVDHLIVQHLSYDRAEPTRLLQNEDLQWPYLSRKD